MTDQAVTHGPTEFLSTTGAPEPGPNGTATAERQIVFDVQQLNFFYGAFQALHGITLDINQNEITALIGPSGCGKTTFLRCLNRLNELIPGTRIEGDIRFHDTDLYGPSIRPIDLRRKVGMVFQKPNPFPKSIWDNVAFAPRANGVPRSEIPGVVEHALRAAALWDEVKDKLKQSAFALSGGQQQRLCIARCIAVKPDVILMDEPAAALDPIATARIEDLMVELVSDFTIVIVTHNLQQASRASHRTAFFTTRADGNGGELVEVAPTSTIFSSPSDPRTEDYVTGRFG